MFLRTVSIIIFINVVSRADNLNEWREVEALAEEHPYIVALLNISKEYTCTGIIIGKSTVLTSGYCTSPEPVFVAVGLAVISERKSSNLLKVAFTQLHDEYTFAFKAKEQNITSMHSNIGLVFVVRPLLSMFVTPAPIGSYFASELRGAELKIVGYGRRYHNNIVTLQYQPYDQSPCANPRWYYCICGTEVPSTTQTYEKDFGNGAPAIYGNDIVGITATISGSLSLNSGVKYNIFTVIGPYISWVEKSETGSKGILRALNAARRTGDSTPLAFIYIFVLLDNL